jgi:hypothetical protein
MLPIRQYVVAQGVAPLAAVGGAFPAVLEFGQVGFGGLGEGFALGLCRACGGRRCVFLV